MRRDVAIPAVPPEAAGSPGRGRVMTEVRMAQTFKPTAVTPAKAGVHCPRKMLWQLPMNSGIDGMTPEIEAIHCRRFQRRPPA